MVTAESREFDGRTSSIADNCAGRGRLSQADHGHDHLPFWSRHQFDWPPE